MTQDIEQNQRLAKSILFALLVKEFGCNSLEAHTFAIDKLFGWVDGMLNYDVEDTFSSTLNRGEHDN